jgi:hypothetical protein
MSLIVFAANEFQARIFFPNASPATLTVLYGVRQLDRLRGRAVTDPIAVLPGAERMQEECVRRYGDRFQFQRLTPPA